jgi:hypothetical protein
MYKLSTLTAALLLAACGGGAGSGGAGPVQAVAPPAQQAAPPPTDMVLVGDDIVALWPAAQLPAGAVRTSSLDSALALRPRVAVLQGAATDQLPGMIQQAQAAGSCVIVVSVLPADVPEDLLALDYTRRQAAYAYGAAYADAYTGLVEPPVDVATRLLNPTLPPDSHKLRAEMDAGDGIHLSPAGYDELGAAISKAAGTCGL